MKPRHFITSLFCAVFIVYPLSIGPAYRINLTNHPKAAHMLGAVYAPLLWVAGKSRPINDALVGYVKLWVGHY
jgi:hypothetical protein